MDFRDKPHPAIAELLEPARAEWRERVNQCVKEIMIKYPQMDQKTARHELNTSCLEYHDAPSLYQKVFELQEWLLPRNPSAELVPREDIDPEFEAFRRGEGLTVNHYLRMHNFKDQYCTHAVNDKILNSGGFIPQLNAIQREINRLNDILFPGGSDRVAASVKPSVFLAEAEVVWEKHPKQLAMFKQIIFLQSEFNRIARHPRGHPDLAAAEDQRFPGPTVGQLFRQEFSALFCLASRELEDGKVYVKRLDLLGAVPYRRYLEVPFLRTGLSPHRKYVWNHPHGMRLRSSEVMPIWPQAYHLSAARE